MRVRERAATLASQSTISRLENSPSRTEAARFTAALVDQAGTTVKPRKYEILDIDDTFCAAMAVSSWRSGTRITTSVALRRCTSRACLHTVFWAGFTLI